VLLVATAEGLDTSFERACGDVLLVRDLIARVQVTGARQGWMGAWSGCTLHEHVLRAFGRAIAPVEPAFRVHGPTISRGFKSLGWIVGDLVASWRAARPRSEAAVPVEEAA
jgi:hypothetical protein